MWWVDGGIVGQQIHRIEDMLPSQGYLRLTIKRRQELGKLRALLVELHRYLVTSAMSLSSFRGDVDIWEAGTLL